MTSTEWHQQKDINRVPTTDDDNDDDDDDNDDYDDDDNNDIGDYDDYNDDIDYYDDDNDDIDDYDDDNDEDFGFPVYSHKDYSHTYDILMMINRWDGRLKVLTIFCMIVW